MNSISLATTVGNANSCTLPTSFALATPETAETSRQRADKEANSLFNVNDLDKTQRRRWALSPASADATAA